MAINNADETTGIRDYDNNDELLERAVYLDVANGTVWTLLKELKDDIRIIKRGGGDTIDVWDIEGRVKAIERLIAPEFPTNPL